MSEVITVELPDELAKRARAIAAQTQRPLEEALVDWIDRAVAEPFVESLPDDRVLVLCDAEMDEKEQQELSKLLAGNREDQLSDGERGRLGELMRTYRRGLLMKAQALKVAVARGLKPHLS
jgi:hypothetical protein